MGVTFTEVKEQLKSLHQFIGELTPTEASSLADRTADPSEHLPEEGVLALGVLQSTALDLPHEDLRSLADSASAFMDDEGVDHLGTSEERAKIWAERHFDLAFFSSFLTEEEKSSL